MAAENRSLNHTILNSRFTNGEGDITKLDPESSIGRKSKRPRNNDGKNDEVSLKYDLMEMLSNWKKDQDVVLTRLCSDMAELKEQNTSIKASSEELEKSIKFMSSQYEDMKIKLHNMERERKEHINTITNLENKIDDMQKKAKFTAIEVRNLPQLIKPESQQDLCELVQKTCKSFNVNIQASDIKDLFRIPKNTGTVVVDLTSTLTRNKIMDGIKKFNMSNPNNKLSSTSIGVSGPAKPIYVTESLTNKDRKLFALARDAARSVDYMYCWTRRGKIYVKKAEGDTRMEIKSETDLKILQKQ